MADEQPRQLALDLPFETAMARDDFIESAGSALARHAIDAPEDWSFPTLAIVAPLGAGKSHLAQIWAHQQRAVVASAADLDREFAEHVIAGTDAVIEDAPVPSRDQDEALFQLLNASAHGRARVLLTATVPPSQWPSATHDLKSRLAAIPVVTIEPPDDALLTAVIMKQLADRQIMVDSKAITYASSRLERTFAAARQFVAEVERLTISKKRHLTVPVAREALAILSQTG
ncbi:MAG: DnaA/Hda family protein [Pseudomonadota bacterium]